MKAAVLNTLPGNLDIEDVQIDSPGPHEVLIRTSAAGLCHSDLHFMEAKYPYMTPAVLGHESAGIVEAVGSEVTYVKPGDHVITCLSVFCGQCDFCISGRPNLCTKEATRRAPDAPQRLSRNGDPVFQFLDLSSFAEQMLVHEGAVVKIRDDMPLDRAALIGCGVTTGVGAVLNTASVRAGETVAVIGCGGVGLSAIQGAAIAGAGRIIAVDMVDMKLKLAESFGATDLVNAKEGDPVGQVLDMTGGRRRAGGSSRRARRGRGAGAAPGGRRSRRRRAPGGGGRGSRGRRPRPRARRRAATRGGTRWRGRRRRSS